MKLNRSDQTSGIELADSPSAEPIPSNPPLTAEKANKNKKVMRALKFRAQYPEVLNVPNKLKRADLRKLSEMNGLDIRMVDVACKLQDITDASLADMRRAGMIDERGNGLSTGN